MVCRNDCDFGINILNEQFDISGDVRGLFVGLGYEVLPGDINQVTLRAINAGRSPIHEPGLDDLLATHGGDAFTATTTYVDICNTEVTFLALPTPSAEDGSIDTSIIEAASETLSETVEAKDGEHLVVTKSTVIPTTTIETLRRSSPTCPPKPSVTTCTSR